MAETTPAPTQSGNILPANHVAVSADDYATYKANESALASLQTKYETDMKAATTKYDKLSKEHKELNTKHESAQAEHTKLRINTQLAGALNDFTEVGRDYIGMKLGASLKLNDDGKVVNDKGESLDDIVKTVKADKAYAQFLNTKRGAGASPSETTPQSADTSPTATGGKSMKYAEFDKLPPAQKTKVFVDNPGLQLIQ